MKFNELNLNAPILKALESKGYTKPTLIQEKAIPKLLEGHDLLGSAQTGTGKTAAFAIPILQDLSSQSSQSTSKRPIQSLVIAPTRELAVQIDDNFKTYAKFTNIKTAVIYGGVPQYRQTKKLKNGVDIIVATPGRLLDLINQGYIKLDQVKHFVLDEADLMLDMGMIDDVKKIVKYVPKKRQTMFFSATMPKAIEKLTREILNNPVRVEVAPVSSTSERIKQEVYYVDQSNKTNLLLHILKDESLESVLVFSRTKHGADRITQALNNNGHQSQAIHGNKSQKQRQRALNNFKTRKTRILVATDIAARGIDIADLSHVINYNLPEVPETYVHRIGRTGRSGNEGVAISFCDNNERSMLKGVQRLTGDLIPENKDNPFELKARPKLAKKKSSSRRRNNNSSKRRSNSNGETSFNKDNKNNNRRNKKNGQYNKKRKQNSRRSRQTVNA